LREKSYKYIFIIFIVGLLLSIDLMFEDELVPNVLGSSLVYLSSPILVFLVVYFKKNTMSSVFKWVNALLSIIYGVFGLMWMLFVLYKAPDSNIYSLESIIFLLGALITANILFILINKNSNKFISFVSLVYFIAVVFWAKDWALIYSFSSVDGISRPFYSAIIFFTITIFISFCLNNVKELSSLFIRRIYEIISILFTFYIGYILTSMLTNLPKPYETSIELSAILIIFCMLVNIYFIREIETQNKKIKVAENNN